MADAHRLGTSRGAAAAAGHRLPVVHQLRQSVGLQRGMLVVGLRDHRHSSSYRAILAPVHRAVPVRRSSATRTALRRPGAAGGAHLLGTTVGGYDVLSRVIWGAQTALLAIIVAIVLSVFLGVVLGLVSGYLGGWLDRVLVVIATRSTPSRRLLLAIVAGDRHQRRPVEPVGRHPRGGDLDHRRLHPAVLPGDPRRDRADQVRGVRRVGQGGRRQHVRIMFRHVLRNSTRTLPLIFTLNASEAILTLAGLGFLGFGIEPTSAAEWGYDLNKAVSDVTSGIWWTSIFPGLAIVLVVLGVTLVGESLNDLADPRLRTRRRAAARTPRRCRGDRGRAVARACGARCS